MLPVEKSRPPRGVAVPRCGDFLYLRATGGACPRSCGLRQSAEGIPAALRLSEPKGAAPLVTTAVPPCFRQFFLVDSSSHIPFYFPELRVPELPDNDGDLREALLRGDSASLGELFARHRDRLWRIVTFRIDPRLRSRLDPDDLLQEAFLDAARRLPHYQKVPEMSPFVWLRQVVKQTMIDHHRRHLKTQRRNAARDAVAPAAGNFPVGTFVSLVGQLLGHCTSPSQVAMRDEVARQLEAALADMEEIDQEVLALRHFEELSNQEVAEVLGIQEKAASIRYVRALRRLKQELDKFPDFFSQSQF